MAERPDPARPSLSVSELTAYVKQLIDRDELLAQVSVHGEISNLARPSSGHLYFSLKDEGSQLRCVCFRGDACRLGFDPEDGQRVLAHGNVTVYEPRGEYQLIVRAMRPGGAGELAEAIAKLRAKLEAEGLFEPSRKRPIPPLPRRIALVTSPTGAAVGDMINVISRRYPPAEITVVPAVVQGEDAPESLVRGLRLAAEVCRPDVVIIGRGGGSLEDLWAFYDERVVRAVFACPVPVISAVGHETDVSLCDEVADLRAPTPSAAGELAVPDVRDLAAALDRLGQRVCTALRERVRLGGARLTALCERPVLCRPASVVEARWQRLDEAGMRLVRSADVGIERLRGRLAESALTLRTLDPRVRRRLMVLDRRRSRIVEAGRRAREACRGRLGSLQHRLDSAGASLRALDPAGVVRRGYALVWRDEDRRLVRSIRQVSAEDGIHVSVADGEIAARVTDTDARTES
ncbi:MAG: exodeoxyribonuclease VII large subunit [Armatimonadota bacterium]